METSTFLNNIFSLVIALSSYFYLFDFSFLFPTEVRSLVKYRWTSL